MYTRKFLNILFVFVLIVPLVFGESNVGLAMPTRPTDETTVPHYFGPNPNWANSPFALPDAQVVIAGDGSGATAEATVGANGVVTGITITNGGSGYSKADVLILGSGSGATARATIVKKGALVGIDLVSGGTGYTAPVVTLSGNGTGAAATAYGSVDQVTLTSAGSGYTMPTVDFDLPDGPGGVQAQGRVLCVETDCQPATEGGSVTITGVEILSPGSGYSFAPGVTIRNGTMFEPRALLDGGSLATATATLAISSFTIEASGADYSRIDVAITDPTGTGAVATGVLDNGVISFIELTKAGTGYIAPGGLRKFVDTLPGLGPNAANNLGQYIPVATPDTTSFANADYYEIAVVEYEEQMHSDLPPTRLRGYVQLETSNVTGIHFPLPGGKFGVDKPHYLGPTIVAQKDRAVRITFVNLLPTGVGGDLFIPVDSSMMGSGMGPMDMMMEPMDMGSVMDEIRNPACSESPKPDFCFADNRATLHLHGGNTPWISDGTPHQWITPAGESTMWPEGVSVVNVPDMVGQDAIDAGIPDCSGPDDGCMTFYYTNQQSARLMFYHDHSWGITRLNVYAGEAAPYIITDETEQKLIANGTIPGPADTIPLVIQDRTFVPQDSQLYNQYDPLTGELLSYGQDPTWDKTRWGDFGDLWYHHVYMPAQNPGSPAGVSGFGRWMYSPWFWPPQNAKYPPIANPYFDPSCNLDDPATWQYQEDPFCEPPLIPSTPLISAGMEQFNDTPIVNGTAYPTVTLDAKAYRLRILNAANDRFWNLQWYVADPNINIDGLNGLGQPVGSTEVLLNPAEVAAAQLDPVVFPTPLQSTVDDKGNTVSLLGPDWVMIGNEGGFLAAPAVIDGQQVTTWIQDPTRFDAGLVDQHSLVLAPAERADAVVDFSQFAGKTLILYNDAPAAYPARIPSYDYYTGAPDLRPVGAPSILPGYGPNTRTIMQVKISANTAPAYNLNALKTAFSHKADGSGVFESGQPPIIVGQAAYNTAYGSNFVSSGWCNAPTNPSLRCDGFARINEQGGDLLKFDTLLGNQVSVKIEPKAIQDETSESSFDPYGRMMGILGVEVVPATPGAANTILLPYAYPPVELFDTAGLPKADVAVTPIASGDDGTQIWKITHNGVDTHPIHFHATDVQILNRVTWDNIIKPPEPDELGWKETIRVSPLEDTYVAMRPIIPVLPFDFPNSVRLIDPGMAEGDWIANTTFADQNGLPLLGFAPNGDPIDIVNHYVNYGAEYVYHCHILSHEEMDMMHTVMLAYPPVAPNDLAFDPANMTLSWTDRSISETAFVVQKSSDGVNWVELAVVERILSEPNTKGGTESLVDATWVLGDQYRVIAQNTVGDTWDYSNPALNEILPGTYAFPVVTNEAASEVLVTTDPALPQPPAAPSNLTAAQQAGPQVSLAWIDNATNETSFLVQKSTDGGVTFADLTTVGADVTSFADTAVAFGNTYTYQVAAVNADGTSAFSNTATVTLVEPPAVPEAPTELAATLEDGPAINLVWNDLAVDETGFVIERSTDGVNFAVLTTVGPNVTIYDDFTVSGGFTYTYRVAAVNGIGQSAYSPTASAVVPAPLTIPAAPSNLLASNITQTTLTLTWVDNANNEEGFTVQYAQDSAFTKKMVSLNVGPDVTSMSITGLAKNIGYYFRVSAYNATGVSTWTPTLNIVTAK